MLQVNGKRILAWVLSMMMVVSVISAAPVQVFAYELGYYGYGEDYDYLYDDEGGYDKEYEYDYEQKYFDAIILYAPYGLQVDADGVLTWCPVENAIGYDVYVDWVAYYNGYVYSVAGDVDIVRTDDTRINLTGFRIYSETHNFRIEAQVRAIGDADYFLDSDLSYSVTFSTYRDMVLLPEDDYLDDDYDAMDDYLPEYPYPPYITPDDEDGLPYEPDGDYVPVLPELGDDEDYSPTHPDYAEDDGEADDVDLYMPTPDLPGENDDLDIDDEPGWFPTLPVWPDLADVEQEITATVAPFSYSPPGSTVTDFGTVTNFSSNLPWRLYSCGTLVVDSGFIEWIHFEPTRSPWDLYIEDINRIVFAGIVIAGTSLAWLFSGMTGLESIEGLAYLNTDNVEDMRGMFSNTSNLISLDLSGFCTSNVTNMSVMFFGSSSLIDLNLYHFDTRNVTSMAGMFSGAYSLTSLDVSNFVTENVRNMGNMFNGASSLTNIDISSFDTRNVNGMGNMFANASSIMKLDLSGFDTRNVWNMDQMFWGMSSLRHLVLNEHFAFSGIMPGLSSLSSNTTYTGHWTNVGTGTVDNPQGNRRYTSAQLMANPTGGLADTWIWERVSNGNGSPSLTVTPEGAFQLSLTWTRPIGQVEEIQIWRYSGQGEPLPGTVPSASSFVLESTITTPQANTATTHLIPRPTEILAWYVVVFVMESSVNIQTNFAVHDPRLLVDIFYPPAPEIRTITSSNVTPITANIEWRAFTRPFVMPSDLLFMQAGTDFIYGPDYIIDNDLVYYVYITDNINNFAPTLDPIVRLEAFRMLPVAHMVSAPSYNDWFYNYYFTYYRDSLGVVRPFEAGSTYYVRIIAVRTLGQRQSPSANDSFFIPSNNLSSTEIYHTGDIAAINNIITTNNLAFSLANPTGMISPPGWHFVTWSEITPRRVIGLDLYAVPVIPFTAFTEDSITIDRPDLFSHLRTGVVPLITPLSTGMTGHFDATALTALRYLNLDDNNLTSINVNGLQQLLLLSLWDNDISTLNLSNLPSLQTLQVSHNNLTSLDISNLPNMQSLYAGINDLSYLNVNGLNRMAIIAVVGNQLEDLDVTGLTNLGLNWTDSWGDWIGVLDVRWNNFNYIGNVTGRAEQLILDSNFLYFPQYVDQLPPTINLHASDMESILAMRSNGLTVPENPADWDFVTSWSTGAMNPFTRVATYARITGLNLSNRNLTGNLDVRGLDALITLSTSNNNLTSVNVTNLLDLTTLNVSNNRLPSQAAVIGLSNPPTTNFIFGQQRTITTTPPSSGDDSSDSDSSDGSGGSGGGSRPPTNRPSADATEPEETTPASIVEPQTNEGPPTPPTTDYLSREALDQITDPTSAVNAVENALETLLIAGGGHLTETDMSLLAMFAEKAIAQAASIHIDSRYVDLNMIIVNQPNLEELQRIAYYTRTAIEQLLLELGHTFNRDISANVAFITTDFEDLDILVEPSAMLVHVDRVWIRTPYYDLSFTHGFMENNAATPLIVTVNSFANSPRSYDITFSRPVTEPVRLSVQPVEGDPYYQTMRNTTTGQIAATNHNPVSGMLESRIRESGRYTVVENRVDFADIQGRSAEMQRAIRALASQGIITGMAPGEFRPDDPLTRAQTAALITNVLGISDPAANFGFADVNRIDWFFTAVNTVRRYEIMSGTGANIFAPHMDIPRDQMIAITARILRNEMNYRDPVNPLTYLHEFDDVSDFADWSITDLSLATRENLVIRRADGRFMPQQTITRGEAAIILYRLYRRIW